MPILANAKKALRSSKRKAQQNALVTARMRTALKQLGKTPDAQSLSTVFSRIDKAVKSNIIHKNKAARLKAQASRQVSAAAA